MDFGTFDWSDETDETWMTLGLVTGMVTFRMWTWASELTLGINAGIPMAGAIRLGRPIAGTTRLGGTSGGQA